MTLVGYAELMLMSISEYVFTGATVRLMLTTKPPVGSPEAVVSGGTTTTVHIRDDSRFLNSSAMTKSVFKDKLGSLVDWLDRMAGM